MSSHRRISQKKPSKPKKTQQKNTQKNHIKRNNMRSNTNSLIKLSTKACPKCKDDFTNFLTCFKTKCKSSINKLKKKSQKNNTLKKTEDLKKCVDSHCGVQIANVEKAQNGKKITEIIKATNDLGLCSMKHCKDKLKEMKSVGNTFEDEIQCGLKKCKSENNKYALCNIEKCNSLKDMPDKLKQKVKERLGAK